MLQELIKMQQSGLLPKMVRAGLVSAKVSTYLEIYLWFDARKQTTNKTTNEIVLEATEHFKVCRQTVFNALRAVKN